MIEFLAWLVSMMASDVDVERLRNTAPSYLSIESARENLGAARLAAAEYDLDPAILLAIAYRESRYTPSVKGPEAYGKMSCGVMQPMPKKRCEPSELELVNGYLNGAAHLREWLRVCRSNMHCALMGYAGGFYLINYCRELEHVNCGIPTLILRRASWIRGSRS